MLKRGLLIVGASLLVAALALGAIACGDDDEEDGGNGASPTATAPAGGEEPTATTAADGEPTSAPGAFTTVVASENAELGTILTTFDGFTLYTFDNDTEGVSTCTGDCANNWQPLVIPGTPTAGEGVGGTLDVVARDDGSMQVTLDGKPLYLYSGDPAAGDTNGDGVLGLWHVVSVGG